MEWLLFIIVWAVLMLLHELGHVICGLLLGYKLEAIVFSFQSLFPHVEMTAFKETWLKHSLFLLSGFGVTLILFIITVLQFNTDTIAPFIYAAFFAQFLAETNPFFSDFSMLLFYKEAYLPYRSDIETLKGKLRDLWYTPKWYLHLFTWAVFAIIFYKSFF